ncbi:TetR/AcrR family transcriptional regulator [Intrasporangium calvum]|uniref:Transcriptional regulator n=1 Tax=Intrasporangium calvum (strain ATCC 23552 / DSM 43043 / JCM 3097 / NBRC 12989 / NCIMB 10167 / NRRL B-3866 / 7 KIP) TaxID=710696 RepID=E6S827_INTC7|nr:TetR/AcrR family transcriptional regulator [Intrasporangium calvum]ADU46931.1 transcriptional regulator [Intrasporangium calvum DSM 43043]
MATAVTRQERMQRRRVEIIQAAVELFQELGFHAATTHQVAERAGLSVGLIYQYFGNKEDLLRSVIVDILGQFRDRIPSAIAAAGPDPVARLRAGYRAYVDVIDENREGALLTYREGLTLSPDGRDEIKKLEIETAAPLRDVILEGIASGAFTDVDAELVVHNLVLTAHGWALKHWRLAKTYDVDGYADRQLDLLLRAIRP